MVNKLGRLCFLGYCHLPAHGVVLLNSQNDRVVINFLCSGVFGGVDRQIQIAVLLVQIDIKAGIVIDDIGRSVRCYGIRCAVNAVRFCNPLAVFILAVQAQIIRCCHHSVHFQFQQLAVADVVFACFYRIYGEYLPELGYIHRLRVVEVVEIESREFCPNGDDSQAVNDFLIGRISGLYDTFLAAEPHPRIEYPDAAGNARHKRSTPR